MANYPITQTSTVDNVLAPGNLPYEVGGEIIAKGEKFKRGALLGLITATGRLKVVTSGATDGSQNLYAIATEDMDTTEDEHATTVYYVGGFNIYALSVREGDDVNKYKTQGRMIGLFLRHSVAAGN